MIIAENTLYLGSAAIFLVAALVTIVPIRRTTKRSRRHLIFFPLVLCVLAASYAGMAFNLFVGTSPGGESVYFLRFLAYSITYTLFMGYVGLVAGGSRRHRLLPVVGVLLFSIGSAVAQMSGPPVESVATLVVFGSFIAVIWGFFRPLSRQAQSVSPERRLLFGKLRNIATLAFIMYLGVALTNRATLGLLDLFVGVFTIAYVDVVIHLGFVGLLVYSHDAVESLATEYDSPLSIFSTQ